MSISKTLDELMSAPLPSLTEQKRLAYRPSLKEIVKMYDLINRDVFNNELKRPEIQLGVRRMCWGWCHGFVRTRDTGSRCIIKLSNKWYCKQWMITVLAHEMSHQYQWDIIALKRQKDGKNGIMSHGPSFFLHRKRMRKHGIHLKVAHRWRKWFKYQDFARC
jgi:hypothetical protein